MKSEKGQVIVLLILVMTVALAIGISVVQRSLSDISTSTKVEESSRALFAAEAGIERSLKEGVVPQFNLENNSSATVDDKGLLPCEPGKDTCPVGRQGPLEEDPLEKEEVAQVWLADYNSTENPPPAFYTQNTLDVYWGTSGATDKAALELTLVYYDGAKYTSKKWYLDQIDRDPKNNFVKVAEEKCNGGKIPPGSTTKIEYQCFVTIDSLPSVEPSRLMLIRARLLYNSTYQPFAVQAVGECGKPCSIPSQQRRIVSTGLSGQTQRRVRLTQKLKVVPYYFDFALFSIGEISK